MYIVRNRWPDEAKETVPAPDVFLSYMEAFRHAQELAKRTQCPHDVDVYEESYDHMRLKHATTYKMSDELDTFT